MIFRSFLLQTICVLFFGLQLGVAAPPPLTQAQAIQTVRTILQKNTAPGSTIG